MGVGMGFRGWGYAAEQIASIDVVTADGELVTADASDHPRWPRSTAYLSGVHRA